jgi:hypothetical protein
MPLNGYAYTPRPHCKLLRCSSLQFSAASPHTAQALAHPHDRGKQRAAIAHERLMKKRISACTASTIT